MGCGQTKVTNSLSSKVHQIPFTAAEISEQYLGGLLASDSVTKHAGSDAQVTSFDDLELLRRVSRLEALTVFYSQFVNGLEVSYYVDDSLRSLTHAAVSGRKARIDFFVNEGIASIRCTYSEGGIHSLEVTSTEGRKLTAVGSLGEGAHSEETSKSNSTGIVGFKGAYSKHLLLLSCYLALMDSSARLQDPEAHEDSRAR
jgi:hypothetical protein